MFQDRACDLSTSDLFFLISKPISQGADGDLCSPNLWKSLEKKTLRVSLGEGSCKYDVWKQPYVPLEKKQHGS